MRRAARRDENEAAIVEALRKVGASVVQLDDRDIPDLLIGYRNRTFLVEVKRPTGPRGGKSQDGQKLSKGQLDFHASWRGEPVVIARTAQDALSIIGCGAVANDSGTVCPEKLVKECSTPFDCFARGKHVCQVGAP